METPTYDYNYYLNKGFRILRKNYISNYIEFLLKSDESHNQWVRFENCSSAERMDLRFSELLEHTKTLQDSPITLPIKSE